MCLSSMVATLHSARRHFGSMDIAGETFLELWETPRLPADHLLSPSSSISFFWSLSPSSSLVSALGQQDLTGCWIVCLWRSVLNRCLFCGLTRGKTGLHCYFLTPPCQQSQRAVVVLRSVEVLLLTCVEKPLTPVKRDIRQFPYHAEHVITANTICTLFLVPFIERLHFLQTFCKLWDVAVLSHDCACQHVGFIRPKSKGVTGC